MPSEWWIVLILLWNILVFDKQGHANFDGTWRLIFSPLLYTERCIIFIERYSKEEKKSSYFFSPSGWLPSKNKDNPTLRINHQSPRGTEAEKQKARLIMLKQNSLSFFSVFSSTNYSTSVTTESPSPNPVNRNSSSQQVKSSCVNSK